MSAADRRAQIDRGDLVKIRSLRPDTLGQESEVPRRKANGLVSLGRAEFVKPAKKAAKK